MKMNALQLHIYIHMNLTKIPPSKRRKNSVHIEEQKNSLHIKFKNKQKKA